MKTQQITSLIPEQIDGKKTDLFHSENFASREEAVKCFNRAYKRILNPRVWHKLAGIFSADFALQDESGIDPHRLATIHDYYKIDIPGPGPSSGDGYDWVKVDEMLDLSNNNEEKESAGIRLTPCANPTNDRKSTAHFFTSGASSTFIVTRIGNSVSSFYYGRNEIPNVKTGSVADNIRNAIISSGALASLSEAQWTALITALLQPEIGG